MPTGRQVAGFLHKARRYLFGYDAVESKNRRQPPTGRLHSEDKELLPHQHRKLTSAGAAAWIAGRCGSRRNTCDSPSAFLRRRKRRHCGKRLTTWERTAG